MSTFLTLAETISRLSGGKYIMVKKSEWESIHNELKILRERYEKLSSRFIATSENSSLPSSKNPPYFKPKKKRRISGMKPGGQKGHEGHNRSLVPENDVDYIIPCNPPETCTCGGEVRKNGSPYKKQVIEIPDISCTVTEYQIFNGVCDKCNKLHKGELPAATVTGNFGVNVQSIVSLMSGKYHLSQDSIKDLLEDLFGLSISAASVLNIKERVNEVLKEPYEEIKSYIKSASRVNMDETGHKQNGNTMWLWIAATHLAAFFAVRLHRGKEECREILGLVFCGIVTSDRYHAYNWLDTTQRQLCWAHLERDFVSLSERGGEIASIANKILSYIQQMFHLWGMFKSEKITRQELKDLMNRIRKRIEKYLYHGTKYNAARNPCKNVYSLKEALWTFVETEGVEPTNNHAEQLLRSYVIWRKISFQTRSAWGNQFIERIMTICTTCRLQKINPRDFISNSINAHLKKDFPPSLLQIQKEENTTQKAA